MNFSKKNLSVIALIIVVGGGAAYFLLGKKDPEATVSVVGAPTSVAQAKFLGLASELETVTFDVSLFKDARFLGLKDIHTNVVSEAGGRKDPFATLPGVSSSQ